MMIIININDTVSENYKATVDLTDKMIKHKDNDNDDEYINLDIYVEVYYIIDDNDVMAIQPVGIC